MTPFKYSLFVIAPNLIFCWVFGKGGMVIEKAARKIRLACCYRMKRIMEAAPPREMN